MRPRLVALDGPIRGHVAELASEVLTIGRGTENGLVLGDASASRHHCEIHAGDDRFSVRDNGSRNGTFVNGVPVRERTLRDGDEIRVGHSVFRFVDADAPTEPASSIRFEHSPPGERTLVLPPRNEDASPSSGEAGAEMDRSAGEDRRYHALIEVASAVVGGGGLTSVCDRLLQATCGVVPAQEGAILLREDGELSIRSWSRPHGSRAEMEVNRPLIDQVLQEGASIVTGQLLATPIVNPGGVAGVICLRALPQVGSFNRDDLRLVSAAGRLAGLALHEARRFDRAEEERGLLQEEQRRQFNMVGESPAMQGVYRSVARVAASDSTVLIIGETGTGKELVARAIHGASARAARPWIAINCAALTESLLESELFGHERGAFTGAVTLKKGKLEMADGGTVFLDEIGELPFTLQAKLLRVLQEREFERVGGTRSIRVNLRIIAATNRDLRTEVARGAFRKDLFYRLDVVTLPVPPLRERRDDVPLLASYFLARFAPGAGREITGISDRARACLLGYDWPGNVRELQNAMERAVVLGAGNRIRPEDLPDQILDTAPAAAVSASGFHGSVKERKAEVVLAAIEACGGNMTAAAKRLQLNPNYLHRLVRNLGLREEVNRRAQQA